MQTCLYAKNVEHIGIRLLRMQAISFGLEKV